MSKKLRPLFVILVAFLVIGWIDYITGVEIRLFPLYFLPLVATAWNFGVTGAIVSSVIAAVIWLLAQIFGGRVYSREYIWYINVTTQFAAFAVVSLLVAKLRELLARERAVSRTDTLTGLNNSRSFYERAPGLASLCRRNNRSLTLAYLDLDNFKRANDTKGHSFGDYLLQRIAEVMKESLRASDFSARMGGDEFVVLLPETGEKDARAALEKLRSQLEQTPQFKECGVTASIGAVTFSVVPETLEEMIKAADNLMYTVKQAGKNRVHVETVGVPSES